MSPRLPSRPHRSTAAAARRPGRGWLVAGLVVAAVGGLTTAIAGSELVTALDQAGWTPARARVIAADVDSRRSGSGSRTSTSYHVRVTFDLAVGGKTYRARRPSAAEYRTLGEAKDEVARIRKRGTVQVFHDPADPSRSTLEEYSVLSVQVALGIGIGVLLVGVLLVAWQLLRRRRSAP